MPKAAVFLRDRTEVMDVPEGVEYVIVPNETWIGFPDRFGKIWDPATAVNREDIRCVRVYVRIPGAGDFRFFVEDHKDKDMDGIMAAQVEAARSVAVLAHGLGPDLPHNCDLCGCATAAGESICWDCAESVSQDGIC